MQTRQFELRYTVHDKAGCNLKIFQLYDLSYLYQVSAGTFVDSEKFETQVHNILLALNKDKRW